MWRSNRELRCRATETRTSPFRQRSRSGLAKKVIAHSFQERNDNRRHAGRMGRLSRDVACQQMASGRSIGPSIGARQGKVLAGFEQVLVTPRWCRAAPSSSQTLTVFVGNKETT